MFTGFLPVGIQWGEAAARTIMHHHTGVPPPSTSSTSTSTQQQPQPVKEPDTVNTKKIIPKPFLATDDPNVFRSLVYDVAKVLPGPQKSDFKIALEDMQYDRATRERIRRQFVAKKPWVVMDHDDIIPNKNRESWIGSIWGAFKDALGYIVFTYQDLYRYFAEYKAGHWTWTNLVQDVAFLWRLAITALITMGLFQMASITETTLRLVNALVTIVSEMFGLVGDVLTSIRSFIMEIFTTTTSLKS